MKKSAKSSNVGLDLGNESSLVFNTLRSYAKHRILNDMIENARRHAQNKDYLIMILDQAALRVFSSCCKFFDVYKANLYHIERLEVRRKRFPQTDAIYFISPTEESIAHLLNDFSDEVMDKEKKPPQYGGVHLCFTSHLSDQLLKEIATRKHLAPRILSFNEINLDFFLFNDNVFHMSRKNILPMFKLIEAKHGIDSPPIQRLLDELCHRLFTVCSVFMECPWVQYQGSSPLAKTLAIKLNAYLSKFYTTQAKEKIKIKEPRGTLLICDRSFDLLSPVLHDFHYQSLVYEFKDVGDEGEVMVGEGKQKMAFLNDQDDLWVRFRNRHIAEVHAKLNQEVSSVVAESKKRMGPAKHTEEMSLQDMAEIIRSNPKYEEMMKKYHVHMELTNKAITEFTQFNMRKLISLEQDIITGLDSKGNKINNTSLVKEISQINKLIRDVDYVRLLMIYFTCYDLNRKDKDTLLKSVPNENYRFILENLEYLDPDIVSDGKKFKRRRPEMSQDQFADSMKRQSASDYDDIRTEPLICELIKQIQDGKIDTSKYPFVAPKTDTSTKKSKNNKEETKQRRGATEDSLSQFERQDVIDNPRIFVFVIGGLSHHEVIQIAKLQDNINCQIIPGSNQIIKPGDFMTQLQKLHKKESDLSFIKSLNAKQDESSAKGKAGKLIQDDEEDQDNEDTQDDNYAINM